MQASVGQSLWLVLMLLGLAFQFVFVCFVLFLFSSFLKKNNIRREGLLYVLI